jgi:hypothetical protein
MTANRTIVPAGRTEVIVDAPAEAVWRVVADVTRTGEWSHECHQVTWLDGASAAATGARFRGRNRSGWLRWSRVCEIVALEPPRRIAWRTITSPLYPDATEWSISLEPVGAHTRIVQTYELTESARWFDWIVARLNPGHLDRGDALTEDLRRIGTLAGGRAVTEPDLSAFLLAHAGFRVEFGRLADAIAVPRDDRHAALIEDQVDFALSYLHHHHADEDAWVWPLLRARAPGSLPLLDALERQHEQIDPVLAVAGDRSRPAAERAEALRHLHEALGRHLDDEERDAVPLIRSCIGADEWQAHGLDVVRAYERRRLPLLFGWASAAGSPEMVGRALEDFPPPVRLLFRLRWWPAYRRRHLELYGTPLRRHPDRP